MRFVTNTDSAGLLSRLETLRADLSANAKQLAVIVASPGGSRADRSMPTPSVPLVAGQRAACHGLDRVAELPALARRAFAAPTDVDMVAQADALASVAAQLAGLVRRYSSGDRAEPGLVGRAAGVGLDPNETRASLVLAAETMSLAARLCLVMARHNRHNGRVRREVLTCGVLWIWPVARVAASTVLVHAGQLWPVALAGVAAIAVGVGRQFVCRSAHLLAAVRVVADVAGLLTMCVALHATPLVLALADALTNPDRYLLYRAPIGDVVEPGPPVVGFDSPAPRPPRTPTENTEIVGESAENKEVVMSYSPGDWIELVRDIEGGSAGQRGKVTSTAFLGGLDITLTSGTRLTGVDASAVKAAPPSSISGDGGCALVGLAAGSAVVAGAVLAGWARSRWGA